MKLQWSTIPNGPKQTIASEFYSDNELMEIFIKPVYKAGRTAALNELFMRDTPSARHHQKKLMKYHLLENTVSSFPVNAQIIKDAMYKENVNREHFILLALTYLGQTDFSETQLCKYLLFMIGIDDPRYLRALVDFYLNQDCEKRQIESYLDWCRNNMKEKESKPLMVLLCDRLDNRGMTQFVNKLCGEHTITDEPALILIAYLSLAVQSHYFDDVNLTPMLLKYLGHVQTKHIKPLQALLVKLFDRIDVEQCVDYVRQLLKDNVQGFNQEGKTLYSNQCQVLMPLFMSHRKDVVIEILGEFVFYLKTHSLRVAGHYKSISNSIGGILKYISTDTSLCLSVLEKYVPALRETGENRVILYMLAMLLHAIQSVDDNSEQLGKYLMLLFSEKEYFMFNKLSHPEIKLKYTQDLSTINDTFDLEKKAQVLFMLVNEKSNNKKPLIELYINLCHEWPEDQTLLDSELLSVAKYLLGCGYDYLPEFQNALKVLFEKYYNISTYDYCRGLMRYLSTVSSALPSASTANCLQLMCEKFGEIDRKLFRDHFGFEKLKIFWPEKYQALADEFVGVLLSRSNSAHLNLSDGYCLPEPDKINDNDLKSVISILSSCLISKTELVAPPPRDITIIFKYFALMSLEKSKMKGEISSEHLQHIVTGSFIVFSTTSEKLELINHNKYAYEAAYPSEVLDVRKKLLSVCQSSPPILAVMLNLLKADAHQLSSIDEFLFQLFDEELMQSFQRGISELDLSTAPEHHIPGFVQLLKRYLMETKTIELHEACIMKIVSVGGGQYDHIAWIACRGDQALESRLLEAITPTPEDTLVIFDDGVVFEV